MAMAVATAKNCFELKFCVLLKQVTAGPLADDPEPSLIVRLLTYVVYTLQLALPTFLIVVVLVIELYTPQIVSFAALLVTFFVIYVQSDTLWKNAYKVIGVMI